MFILTIIQVIYTLGRTIRIRAIKKKKKIRKEETYCYYRKRMTSCTEKFQRVC